MAKTYLELTESVRDTGFQGRVRTALVATSLSLALNGETPAPQKALAKLVLASSEQYAEQWALAIRVAGANITKDTLTDAEITSGVETVFPIFAG